MTTPLSGTQYTIATGDYAASIASVGASLRGLTHAGRDLVVPFDADEVRPVFRGATLAPWPNRIGDGRYEFGGVEHQVALTEPQLGNALHGLVAWADFTAVEQSVSAVVLETTIEPQSGYPFRVLISTRYSLSADGLTQSVTGTNLGGDAAPFGTGPHPYLVAGAGHANDWTLELPAAEVLLVTEDRLLPVGVESVTTAQGGAFDFREPRQIDDLFIDHAFTALDRDDAGLATVRVTTAEGSGVAMIWDAACPWVQIHTADQKDPVISRIGLAVEPMTCPPDAFNSGVDLIVLEPGAPSTASWVIRAI